MTSSILPRKWQIFAVTYFAYAVVYITRKSFSVVKTLIQDDLGLSTYVLGTIDSVFLGTYALFQVFLPSLSDAVGVRPVLLCSLWAAAFFSLTFAVSYSPQALIYSWLFEGISHAPVFAVLVKAVSLWFPPCERGRVLGVWTTSQQIGAMAATTLATFVSTTFGWRAAFTTAAIITAGTAVLVSWTLPEPPAPQMESNAVGSVELPTVSKRRKSVVLGGVEESDRVEVRVKGSDSGEEIESDEFSSSDTTRQGNSAVPTRIGSVTNSPRLIESVAPAIETPQNVQPMKFLDVLRIPNLIACGVAYFCVKLVRYALLFWLPYFLITELGFGTSLAGYSSMLFDLGGVFGAVASGFLTDRVFKGKRLTTAAVMCVATSFSLFLFAHSAVRSPARSIQQSSTNPLPIRPIHQPNSVHPTLMHSIPAVPLAPDTHSVNGSYIHSLLQATGIFTRSAQLNSDPATVQHLSSSNNPIVDASHANESSQLEPPLSTSLSSLTPPPTTFSESASESNSLSVAPIRLLRQVRPSGLGISPSNLRVNSSIPRGPERPANFIMTLVLMTLVGFFVAGPDSILGAASAGEICERCGNPSAQLALSTATGIVNGLGAFGGVVQGYLTALISETWGWPALFWVLCVAALGSVAALWRCISEDWKSPSVGGTARYVPVSTKKDERTTD